MKITIPKPCHENWEMMTPEDKGRFCAVCSKTVRDFTNASDEEIINAFSNTSENICGNFNESQLDRYLQYSYLNSLLTKFAVGFVFTTAGFVALNAQKTTAKDTINRERTDGIVLTGFTTKKECKQIVTGITTVTSEEHVAKESVAQLRGMTSGVKIKDTVQSDRLILGGIHSVKIDDYRPLYVLDGKIISEKKFRKLDQKSIKTMNVLKGASATAIYGEKGKNGVILVKTK